LFLPENSPSRPNDLLRPARSRRRPPLSWRLGQLRTDGYTLHVSDAGFVGSIRHPAFGKIRGVKVVLARYAHKGAHPVNAILNYAYTVLESDIRIKAISEGYDPTIGIMHEGWDGSSKFVFDLMEPKRPQVDRAVLDFVKDPADFSIRSDGVVRLNPQMARAVVARVAA
jgi:hypothetical protein